MSTPEQRRKLSQTLLGNKHRLNVWAAALEYTVEPPQPLSLLDIARTAGINAPTVLSEIALLASVGAVKSAELDGGTRQFVRVESEIWDGAAALVAAADTRAS